MPENVTTVVNTKNNTGLKKHTRFFKRNTTIGLYIFINLWSYSVNYAQNRTHDLPPLIVEGKLLKPEKIIKLLAENFRQSYAPTDIISPAEEFRAVSANGNFIDLKAGLGYLYTPRYDRNACREENLPAFCFLDRYASNSYRDSGTDILSPESLPGKYPAAYSNRMGAIPECVVNLAVSYSPLNPKYIKYYTYKMQPVENASRVYFTSLKNAVPGKCKIDAEGYIDYRPGSFSIENITITRLDSYLYGRKTIAPYAHTNYVSISFYDYPGRISIHSLYYARQWKETSAEPGTVHLMAQPVRRNPVKYKIKEYYLLTIAPPLYAIKEKEIADLDSGEKRTDIETTFSKRVFHCFRYECATFTPSLWEKLNERNFYGFPFDKAWKDLNEKQKMDEQTNIYLDYIPSETDYNYLKTNYGPYFDNIFQDYRSFLIFYDKSKKSLQNEYSFQK